MSDDGTQAVVIIAMLGSPFSPWYANARAPGAGAADALRFCAFNVALYERRASTWALVETDRAGLGSDSVSIGGSHVERRGSAFDVTVDTRAPLVSRTRRIRGRIHAAALAFPDREAEVVLDAAGRHRWRPVAPLARVELDFTEPRTRWSGFGYVDKNVGSEPLENAFRSWTWSRAHLRGGGRGTEGSLIHYDVEARSGGRTRVVRAFGERGGGERLAEHEARAVREVSLGRTRWGLERKAFADDDGAARVVQPMEDTPFYARSLVEATLCGQKARAVHEVLSLDRFRAPWVRLLLPFRIRRELGR